METLPQIIDNGVVVQDVFPYLDERETEYINEAKKLIAVGMYSYSLVAIWNAAVSNLRRKVEAYGADLWLSVIKDEPGRKNYVADGDSIVERWSGVDDFLLLEGSKRLGLLDGKAAKSLEMVNWMRNHASSAHDSDCKVNLEDVVGLVFLIQSSLFAKKLPDPGHSISSLFKPVKNKSLDKDDIDSLKDQIRSLGNRDIRTAFGFLLDLIVKGEEPSLTNARELFPTVWSMANEDLKKQLGDKYHLFILDPDLDESSDKKAKFRIIDLIVNLNAVKYIPEGTRARLFRRAAVKIAEAKNSMYGWGKEEIACKNLMQLGTSVPAVAFEDVYQEILAVWCGNYWGRSGASEILRPFIDCLNTDEILQLANLFSTNKRVREELHQKRPNNEACCLLEELKDKVTFEIHKGEIDNIKSLIIRIKE